LVAKIVEILGSVEAHDGEESLAVMCILEKVILGHQSNRGIILTESGVYPKKIYICLHPNI
jgi:hypothetical protein